MRASGTLDKSARAFGAVREIDLRTQLKALVAGLIGGLVALSATISYPAVLFAGELEVHLPTGIGLALFSTAVLAAVVAFGSSLPGVIANAQLEPSVILGIMGSSMVVALGPDAPDGVVFGTLLLLIVLASLSFGLVMLILGIRRRGNLVRYVPFPVIGGFFIYLVWLLLLGGLSTMLGHALTLDSAGLLVEADQLLLWLPGLLAAAALFGLQMAGRHSLNVPLVLVGAVGLFWLVAWIAAIPLADLQAGGYLLPELGGQDLWSPVFLLGSLSQADWLVALDELPQLVALWLVATITLLLSASSLEVASRRDVDLNQELKATGIANLLCGLGGGLPGYLSASASLLPLSLGAMNRLVGLVVALMSAAALFFAADLLGYVPKLLLGLVLIYLALDIAAGLVLDRWSKMPRIDRALMVLVFVSLVAFGFLPGIAIGVIAGLALFAYSYARIDIVRTVGSGARFRSNVFRPSSQLRFLAEHAAAIQVVSLQGYVFFGSAHNFQQRVKAQLGARDAATERFLILDFARVDGADSSALFAFTRLFQAAEEEGYAVLFAAVPERLSKALQVAGLAAAGEVGGRAFADLDHALEHAEDAILGVDAVAMHQSGLDQLEAAYPALGVRKQVLTYCERVTWRPDEVAMREGEASDSMFFVESGRLTAWRTLSGGGRIRLRTLVPGTVVGEVGFYLHTRRSATIVADQQSAAFRITRQALRRMQEQDPSLSAMFHRFMATIAAERAADNVRQLATRNA